MGIKEIITKVEFGLNEVYNDFCLYLFSPERCHFIVFDKVIYFMILREILNDIYQYQCLPTDLPTEFARVSLDNLEGTFILIDEDNTPHERDAVSFDGRISFDGGLTFMDIAQKKHELDNLMAREILKSPRVKKNPTKKNIERTILVLLEAEGRVKWRVIEGEGEGGEEEED